MHHFCIFRALNHADEWTAPQLEEQMVFFLLIASTGILTDDLHTIFFYYWNTLHVHIDVLLLSDAYTAKLLITELGTA